jgi:hypothetical protein
MIEVEVFIPQFGNDGRTFDAAEIAAFEARAIALFGGVSRLGNTVRGLWAEDGVIFTDESVAYVVAIKSLTDGGKVAELVEFAKAHFSQLAIYVRYLGQAEII